MYQTSLTFTCRASEKPRRPGNYSKEKRRENSNVDLAVWWEAGAGRGGDGKVQADVVVVTVQKVVDVVAGSNTRCHC